MLTGKEVVPPALFLLDSREEIASNLSDELSGRVALPWMRRIGVHVKRMLDMANFRLGIRDRLFAERPSHATATALITNTAVEVFSADSMYLRSRTTLRRATKARRRGIRVAWSHGCSSADESRWHKRVIHAEKFANCFGTAPAVPSRRSRRSRRSIPWEVLDGRRGCLSPIPPNHLRRP